MRLRRKRDNWRRKWRAYGAIYWSAFKGYLHYPQLLRASMLMMSFRIFILFLVYSYAFKYIGRTVNGVDASIAVWSIGLYFLILHSQFRGVFDTVNKEIRNGQLETQLNKPYGYLAYKFWEHWGKSSLNFFTALLVALPLLYLLVGVPAGFSVGDLFAALILMLGGSLVSAALYSLIALPALWIDDATPLFWIVDKTVMILGGAYVPVALLPDAFQNISALLPFAAPMFAAQMFNPDFMSRLPLLLVSQLFWILVLGFTVRLLFERARKSVSINGG